MNRKQMKFMFSVPVEGEIFSAWAGETEAAYCGYSDGEVEFRCRYTYREEPLRLRGRARPGDRGELRMLPWRIELWLGGHCADEEWPCGEHFLGEAELRYTVPCSAEEYIPEARQEPTVLGTFTGAEGWKPEENVFVGDCMPYSDNGRYHVLYLKDRHHHQSKWHKGAHQWAHISTEDGETWQIHPMAVEIDDPEEGSICTGSWIAAKGKQYLFYTVRTCDGSPAGLCRSVSEDGYHFRKDPDFRVYLSEKYDGPSARDPKAVTAPDGTWHMFLTTSLVSEKKGCLAHLVSADMETWREEPEPIFLSETEDQPECSDWFYKDGWYYLVCSLRSFGQYRKSRKPFTDWEEPEDPGIPCKSVPKAALWRDRILFAGFDGGGRYGGTMTFMEAGQKENGELIFFPWKGETK